MKRWDRRDALVFRDRILEVAADIERWLETGEVPDYREPEERDVPFPKRIIPMFDGSEGATMALADLQHHPVVGKYIRRNTLTEWARSGRLNAIRDERVYSKWIISEDEADRIVSAVLRAVRVSRERGSGTNNSISRFAGQILKSEK